MLGRAYVAKTFGGRAVSPLAAAGKNDGFWILGGAQGIARPT
jgi:hypothetical protein